METISLKAQVRDTATERADHLRKEDLLPIECYGHNQENLHLKANYQDFRRAYIKAGNSTLIDLDADGSNHKVLVQDVQFDPVSDKMIHVDFKLVNLKEKLTANILIKLVGEAPAVKDHDGVLVQNLDEVEVRCLPSDLVHDIEVDITSLANIHDSIKVGDLKISDKLEVLTDAELPVVAISEKAEEVEEAPAEEAAEGEEGAEATEGEEKKEEASEEKSE